MKRSLLLVLAPVFLLACQDRHVPTEPQVPEASFDISDGAHDHPDVEDNPHFFWLPPMVEEPSFSGVFEDDLLPTVRICPGTDPTPCDPVDAALAAEADLRDGHYQLNWKTDRGEAGETFRIWALVGSVALGFADAELVRRPARERRVDDPSGTVIVRAGSTLPVKFRIEQGALCPETNEEECAAATVSADEETTVAQDDGDNVTVPAQESGFFDTEDGLVTEITVVVEPCGEGDELPIDLPLFGDCLKITTDPTLTGELDPFAVVSMCTISLDPGLPTDEDPQHDLLTLHRFDRENNQVFALSHALENCPEDQLGSSGFNGLLGLAESGWHTVRDAVATVLGPEPLYATASATLLDVGGGGETGLFSSFQIALPAKMEVLEGDGQTADVGTEVDVPPAVHVTDARGGDVAGARVTFAVTSGDGTIVPTDPILTDGFGIARLDSWTLGPEVGTNTVTASGRGIADSDTNGPQAEVFDPFWPDFEVPEVEDEFVLLETGEVVFTAEGTQPIDTGDDPPPLWIDDIGTGLNQSDDDCDFVEFGFTFTFYGNDYTGVWVNSNGNLTFGSCNTAFSNTNVPDGSRILVAPLYGDFHPGVGGDVYSNLVGSAPNRTFVVTWLEVPEFSNADGPGTSTFQAQLQEGSNTIVFGYNTLTTDGINWTTSGATGEANMEVGISSGTGSFIRSAVGSEIPGLQGTNICYTVSDGVYSESDCGGGAAATVAGRVSGPASALLTVTPGIEGDPSPEEHRSRKLREHEDPPLRRH